MTSESSSSSRCLLKNKNSADQGIDQQSLFNLPLNKPYLLYPDYTVGTGITPVQLHKDVGRGLLPPVGSFTLPLKINYFLNFLLTKCITKNHTQQPYLTNFFNCSTSW